MQNTQRAEFISAFFPRLDALAAGEACGLSDTETAEALADPIVAQSIGLILDALMADVAKHGRRIARWPARGSSPSIGFIHG